MSKLRSTFLSSIRPFFDADSDRRAAAQAERDKIKVTSSKKPDVKVEPEPEKVEAKEDDTDTDKEDDKKGDDEGKDDDKESDDDSEKDEDDKEEKEDKVEITPEVAKLNKTIERLQRRVGKTTGEKAELQKAKQALETALAAKAADGEGFTEEEVERRAEIKANEKASVRAFEAAQAKLLKSATKVDKDFKDKINEVAEDCGAIPGAMIGILEDLDNENGGAVLAYLANNPDDYEEIIEFGLTKMANRLNKLSDKILEDTTKSTKKKLSKVPAPIEPIRGSTESPNVLPINPTKDKDSMEKFVKMREQQVLDRRKLKYGY